MGPRESVPTEQKRGTSGLRYPGTEPPAPPAGRTTASDPGIDTDLFSRGYGIFEVAIDRLGQDPCTDTVRID